MNNYDLAVCILAKYPVKGNVKTRLSADIGEPLAVSLYKKLLLNTITQIKKINTTCDIFVVSSDLKHKKLLEEFLLDHVSIIFYKTEFNQFVSPLIKEVFNNFLINKKYKKVIITCSDSPFISSEIILEASRVLDKKNTLFLSPASDGCYSIIGLNNFVDIFSVSDRANNVTVIDKTISLALLSGVNTYLSKIIDDIDTKIDVYKSFSVLTAQDGSVGLIRQKLGEIINVVEKNKNIANIDKIHIK